MMKVELYPKFVTIINEKDVQRSKISKPYLEKAKEKLRVGEQDLKVIHGWFSKIDIFFK